MGNNDISKFNGQYLKCIVTKHKGTIKSLSDKGALIIYQNNNRNYAYLGNEFIASGYGFDSLEKINQIESIINSYNDDLSTISDSIQKLSKELSNTNENIENKFADFTPNLNIIDPISNKVYNISEIYFSGENAKYKDIEVTNFKKSIFINDDYDHEIIIDDNIIELPIGTKINKIRYDLSYTKNDTSGISEIIISYFKSYEDYETYINNDDINNLSVYTYKNNQYNINASSGNLSISFDFGDVNDQTAGFYITKSYNIPIVYSIELFIKGTNQNQYKQYPGLTNHNELYSIENIIDDHNVKINEMLYIKPITYMYYRINNLNCKYSSYNNTFNYSDYSATTIDNISLAHICQEILIDPIGVQYPARYWFTDPNEKKNKITINKVDLNDIFDINIPIDNVNYNVFTFFIPYSYKIHKVTYVTKNSEYNLTGAVGYIDNINNSNRSFSILTNGPSNSYYFLKSTIYQMTINSDIVNNERTKKLSDIGFLRIKLICTEQDFENDLINKKDLPKINEELYYPGNEVFSDYYLGSCKKWTILNDEEFNRTHWISGENVDEIKNKLTLINELIG